MKVRKDPLLTIWQARNLLVEVEVFPETHELSKIIAETEMALINLMLKMIAGRKLRDRPRLWSISTSGDERR